MESKIEAETIFSGLLVIVTSCYGHGNMMLP